MQKIGTVAVSYQSAQLAGANVSGDRSDYVVQTALLIAFPSLCRLKAISADRGRWSLLSLDRLPSNDLKMTQQLIANMPGLRRSAVQDAAMKLQDAGLIRYSYGNIEVQDRSGFEKCVCECYAVLKRECDRLLPDLKAI
jgi:CRP-like cAMP-binding protein